MKIVIACDSFKGSCSALEVADSISAGIRNVFPSTSIVTVPVADGGEGTMEAFLHSLTGEIVPVPVTGPLGSVVDAQIAVLGNGTAVIEMASASGYTLISPERRDPMNATTYGTGQLIAAALDAGCRKIVIGIGGSATNDAGVGMAQALGARFLDARGQELPFGGGSLNQLASIDVSGLDKRLADTEITVACDVTNPLCGKNGASWVYGPQKGADMETVKILDRNLQHFSDIAERQLGRDVANIPGSGAAGGLGAGLILFCNARIKSGISTLLDAIDFKCMISDADLVITGEGCMDSQTLCGKVPVGVAQRVKACSKAPVVAIVGTLGVGAEAVYDHGIDSVTSIIAAPMSLEQAMTDVRPLLIGAAERLMRMLYVGRNLQF